jgi:hypothetical protein
MYRQGKLKRAALKKQLATLGIAAEKLDPMAR